MIVLGISASNWESVWTLTCDGCKVLQVCWVAILKSESHWSYGVGVSDVESLAYGNCGKDDICEFDSGTDGNECRSGENEACELHFKMIDI